MEVQNVNICRMKLKLKSEIYHLSDLYRKRSSKINDPSLPQKARKKEESKPKVNIRKEIRKAYYQ